MTRERLRQISIATFELLAEIEWIDVSPEQTKAREIFADMLAKPEFLPTVRELLEGIFESAAATPEVAAMIGHQEPILEATAMVQSALKRTLKDLGPPGTETLLGQLPFTAKFRSMPQCFTQAPPNAWVPSMADQMKAVQGVLALPFEPEEVEELRRRYSAAVNEPFDVLEVARTLDLPGQKRKHIFDLADGYRLLITKMRTATLGELLHVSGCRQFDDAGNLLTPPSSRSESDQNEEAQRVLDRFREISGELRDPAFRIVTPVSVQLFFKVA